MSPVPTPTTRQSRLVAAAAAVLLVLTVVLLLGPTGRDDTYKTIAAAEGLALSGSIHNYNGEAVEQSSSLLQVMVLGGLRFVAPMGTADLNFMLTLAVGCLGIFLAFRSAAAALGTFEGWCLAIGLGLHGTWAYWSGSGQDAVWSGCCWLGLLIAARIPGWPGRIWTTLCIVLVLMVRPENGPVALFALGLNLVHSRFKSPVGGKEPFTIAAAPIMIALVCSIALAGVRFGVFGQWLPQSAMAKASGLDLHRARNGLSYLWKTLVAHPEIGLLGIGFLMRAMRIARGILKPEHSLGFWVVVAGGVFVILGGGDWMENGRFLVPYTPILVVIAVEEAHAHGTRGSRFALSLLPFGSMVGLLWLAATSNTGYGMHGPEAKFGPTLDHSFFATNNRVHERDQWPMLQLLAAHDHVYRQKLEKVQVLSQQAGFMPYHLARLRPGEFHFVDLVGLSTTDLARCPTVAARGSAVGGSVMDLEVLMDLMPQLAKECGFNRPDIIFGLDQDDGMLVKVVEEGGYILFALQTGTMPRPGGCFPGMEMSAIEFVAVDQKWSAGVQPLVRDASELYQFPP